MKKVFVIILNWNKPGLTMECLRSILNLSITNYQLSIIVVDNKSTDDSVKLISKYTIHNSYLAGRQAKFHILINEVNLGFAGGNNVGIKYALNSGADYVMVLNNDTVIDKKLMVKLLSTFNKFKNVGVVSPKIYFAKGFEFHKSRYKNEELGRVIWYAGGDIDWENVYGTNRGVDEVDQGQFDIEKETDYATGTCSMFSAEVLRKVGLYNDRYFMYYEDTDLSVRIRKLKYRVMYVPKAYIWHKVAQSSGIGSNLNDYYISRNRMLFGFRYAPLKTKLALIKESIKLLRTGRKWQRIGIRDFYIMRFGKGSLI